MGLLDNFEKGLERAVNGAFAKTFRSGLQPVEITAALKRELDTKAAVVSRDRVLVPNTFRVRMSRPDLQRMSSLGPALVDELTDVVQQHAASQGFQFAGGIQISLDADEGLSEGMVQVDSSNVKGEIAWTPVLDIGGRRHPILKGRTVIGRGSEADITLDDSGASRKHVEVQWDGRRARVRDLGSTNGTQLNGDRVGEAILEPDSVITVGRTRIVFRVLAQAAPGSGGGAPSTRRNDMNGFWGPAE
ncbi:FhaA domain-containing protein [Agromyces sp. SYSU T00194]|uniref:FhaA domain-containing protein n=1 Tax=Agromyces chitinivorans TaxID=3158560 RepID=UPI00339715B0